MAASLTVITGPMFSGKTSRLLELADRASWAEKKTVLFNHSFDKRYSKDGSLATHNGQRLRAIAVSKPEEIPTKLRKGTKLILIDEAHFFSRQLIDVVEKLLEQGIEIIIAGLDQNFRGEGFGPIPELLARADKVEKLTAVCTYKTNGKICAREATMSQRLINGNPASYDTNEVMIGSEETYAARCREHHFVPAKSKI